MPSAEQDDDDFLSSREIHAVTGSDVNPHSTHAGAHRSHLAEISQAGGFEAGEDTRFSPNVAHVRQLVIR